MKRGYRTEIQERVLLAEDGLLLGNGDLSVSIYQKDSELIFRFGKGDVWDRRLDTSLDPRPPHIREIARGVRDEGWACGPYGGPVTAMKQPSADPQRMREICQGCPPSYDQRPTPCPKPVGEFALHWPADLTGCQLKQTLEIGEGLYRLDLEWDGGVHLRIEATVPPAPNVLAIRWWLENWRPEHAAAQGVPPVWASLYRWADPSIAEFQARFYGDSLREILCAGSDRAYPPLPPPFIAAVGARYWIEQPFPAEATFPDGFICRLIPFAPSDHELKPLDVSLLREARIQVFASKTHGTEGWFAVGVATSGDDAHLSEVTQNLIQAAGRGRDSVEDWFRAARESAMAFWARSKVEVSEPLVEALWYETLHARRCAYLAGRTPPGLYMPSSLADYTHWHGDYHTNYNYQSPFWGDYTANHTELGDAFFDGMEFMSQAGEIIARRYYDARGVFIQLTNYPILATDDPLGAVPMGRMAYMTGWMAGYAWTRYRYSMDESWLRDRGYPIIKASALFYLDFLKKGDDGFYHAFPSNQGEDGFTGDVKDFTDRPQVIQHTRYTLRVALKAARVLKIDETLCGEWNERLVLLAGDGGSAPAPVSPLDEEMSSPELSHAYSQKQDLLEPWPATGNYLYDWYCGQYPWMLMQAVRSGDFPVDNGWRQFCAMIRRWRQPNGLLRAMAAGRYGHVGGWTESMGITAPLQEMMLQSWSGVIRVFPAWPRVVDCTFTSFRAEGAFLVSASCRNGQIGPVRIVSERGILCRIQDPFQGHGDVLLSNGSRMHFTRIDGGVLEIATEPGLAFEVVEAKAYL